MTSLRSESRNGALATLHIHLSVGADAKQESHFKVTRAGPATFEVTGSNTP
jgi:hypothetical protein